MVLLFNITNKYQKMFYIKLFLVLIISFWCTQTQADQPLDKLQVVASSFSPYSYSEGGTARGIAVNKVRQLLDTLKYAPKIKVYPWARAYNTTLHTPNTMLFSVARTAEREESFYWIGQIIDFNVYLYKDKKRTDIILNDLTDAAPYRIGALNQDVKGEYLRKKGLNVIDIPNEENAIMMAQQNNIALLPMDAVSMKFRLHKLGLSDDAMVETLKLEEISHPLYIVMNKDSDPLLVETVRQAFSRAFAQ